MLWRINGIFLKKEISSDYLQRATHHEDKQGFVSAKKLEFPKA